MPDERPRRRLLLPSGEPYIPDNIANFHRRANAALQAGKAESEADAEVVKEMRLNRRASMQKKADWGTGISGSQVSFATGRSRDPMFYWRQSNLPFDYEKEEELIKLRRYARLIYLTHPVIASCLDVYSHWPLTGMHFTGKDEELNDFYTEQFFDDLDYEEFLPDLAHAYWCHGEALPLGQFNETLGIWEDDELINPDDVNVIDSPFLKQPRFEMRVPEVIREIVTKREPEWEYRQLVRAYPELVRYAQTEEFMPVSSVLMKQIAFKPDKFFHRGIPIIMRAFRYIFQEEMLNAAVDSIASRLYTPLILVRLGATAQDMGTDVAWVPDAAELQEFEMALDTALAADFRVLTSHFATQVDQVFGRESMPDFSSDYDRLMDRQLLAFGLSRTLLMGADSGETYAADALNRDLVTMLLSRLQRYVTKFYKERAYVVAKAQGHYDYEVRGGKPYPIMEEKLIMDPDGTKRIVEQPKLLIPDLKFRTLNLQDENLLRQFVEQLRESGVPISMQTRMQNIGIDLEAEYELVRKEQVRMAKETQETRKETFLELRNAKLPIPEDIEEDFAPKVLNAEGVAPGDGTTSEEQLPLPNEMIDPAASTVPMTPSPEDYAAEGTDEDAEGDAEPEMPPEAEVANAAIDLMRSRPPESDEARARMPKASMVMNGRTMNGNHTANGHSGSPYLNDPGVDTPELIIEGKNRLISGPSHIEPGEDTDWVKGRRR